MQNNRASVAYINLEQMALGTLGSEVPACI